MPAGNASNTVFTAIPVGEDFFMSFSTARFFAHIAPQDFTELTFKLYDARRIGSLTNPSPSAIIVEYNSLPYDAATNPTGRPGSFTITDDSIAVLINSFELDDYEQTRMSNPEAVFRGELYGYIEAEVTGEQTEYVRFVAAPLQGKLSVQASLTSPEEPNSDEWWDSYFFPEDVRIITCKAAINAPALGVTS